MFEEGGPTFVELAKQALSSTRDGYDLLAPKFDKTPFRTPDDVVEKALSVVPGDVDAALDLCCGTGVGLATLSPRTKRRLVGVDFSPGMLGEARRHLGLGSLAAPTAPSVELVERDVFDTRFDEEFDLVTCFGAFGHILPEAEPAFVELVRRALVRGGRFVFVTADKPSPFDPKALVARGFNAVMRARNAFVSPPFIMYYLTFLLPDVERLLRWKGFEVTVHRGLFEAPFTRLAVVVAKRP